MPSLAAAGHRSLPPSYGCRVGVETGGYIRHTVSKFDTLAGVAIKYGVQVADIKRLNGLVTDLQMFALPSLRIPLPGRHPPSYSISEHDISLSNVDPVAPPHQLRSPLQKATSGMTNLHNFYGLPPTTKSASGGTEFGGYKMSKSNEKSRTTGNGYWIEKGLTSGDLLLLDPRDGETEGCVDSNRRRWLKSENDVGWETPEKVITEENDGSSHSRSSSITGKRLALRPKSAGRVTLASDESGWLSSSSSSEYSPTADAPSKVHKSFSLSNMLDQDLSSFTSLWSNTKWRLKPDFQSGSTSTLTNPLLEGLPNLTQRNKTALD